MDKVIGHSNYLWVSKSNLENLRREQLKLVIR